MKPKIEDIKRLKELTGIGLTDAKAALAEASGDFDKALEVMRKKGLTRAENKGTREAKQGLIDAYLHGGRIGAMVEVNCETDFVARTDEFKSLVHDICMQVAASAPEYVSLDQVPDSERRRVGGEMSEQLRGEGKPPEMIPKIVEGMLIKHFSQKVLLEQPFIKNPDITVGELIKQQIARLGENIVVRQFSRLELGL